VRCLEYVLEVIDDQHQPLRTEVLLQAFQDRPAGVIAQTYRARNGRHDQTGLAQRSEIDEKRSMVKASA
jgi:hypothetical protein